MVKRLMVVAGVVVAGVMGAAGAAASAPAEEPRAMELCIGSPPIICID